MIGIRHIRLDSSDPQIRASGWCGEIAKKFAFLYCDEKTRESRVYHDDGRLLGIWERPLDALRWMSEFKLPDLTEPDARWVGFLSYDLGREFEEFAPPPGPALGVPLFAFGLVTLSEDAPSPAHVRRASSLPSHLGSSTFERGSYEAAVRRCVEYVRAGDVFQVNLSQRLTALTQRSPQQIYDSLLRDGGAAYGALLDFNDFSLLSHSPELFLRVDRAVNGYRTVTTRPIKGTRPAAVGMETELRDSEKDQAELNMIIDLERNDLGRICKTGSVRVTQPRAIERHPTVYHGVATVEGLLTKGIDFVDLLRATFPGGSVTGAPKIRAMEIIDELEPVRRGPYCGAIGYLAADGSMQFNVAIRTMTFKDGLVHVPVGGGIVADSDPASEYEETLVKARAMFDALGIPRDAYDR